MYTAAGLFTLLGMTDHTVVVNSGLYTLVQLAANDELSTWRAEHPEFGVAVFTCATGLHVSELVGEAETSVTISGRRVVSAHP